METIITITIIATVAMILLFTVYHTERKRKTSVHYDGVNDTIQFLSMIGLIQLVMFVLLLLLGEGGWTDNINKIIAASWTDRIIGTVLFYGLSFICAAVVGAVVGAAIDN
jgi:uncharacterized protein involved in cysteine biosynthesis